MNKPDVSKYSGYSGSLRNRSLRLSFSEIAITFFPIIVLILLTCYFIAPRMDRIEQSEARIADAWENIAKMKVSESKTDSASLQRVEKEIEVLRNDMRQETDNVIDKMNLWLALWLTLIAVFGGFIPVILQYRLYIVNRKKLDEEISYYRNFVRTHSIHNMASNVKSLTDTQLMNDSEQKTQLYNTLILDTATVFEDIIQECHENDGDTLSPKSISMLTQCLLQLHVIADSLNRKITTRKDLRDFNKISDNIKWTLHNLTSDDKNKKHEVTYNSLQKLAKEVCMLCKYT